MSSLGLDIRGPNSGQGRADTKTTDDQPTPSSDRAGEFGGLFKADPPMGPLIIHRVKRERIPFAEMVIAQHVKPAGGETLRPKEQ